MSLRLIAASTHRDWSIQPPTTSSPSSTVSLPSLHASHSLPLPYTHFLSLYLLPSRPTHPALLVHLSINLLPACLPACRLPGFLYVRPSVCAFVSSLSVVYRTLIQPSIRLTHPPLTVQPLLSYILSHLYFPPMSSLPHRCITYPCITNPSIPPTHSPICPTIYPRTHVPPYLPSSSLLSSHSSPLFTPL
jgi:hypothetical protein